MVPSCLLATMINLFCWATCASKQLYKKIAKLLLRQTRTQEKHLRIEQKRQNTAVRPTKLEKNTQTIAEDLETFHNTI